MKAWLRQVWLAPTDRQIAAEKFVLSIVIYVALAALFHLVFGAPNWAANIGAFFGMIWYRRFLDE